MRCMSFQSVLSGLVLVLWAMWLIAPSGAAKLITSYSLIIAHFIVCAYHYEVFDLCCNGHFFIGVYLGRGAGCSGTSLPFFAVIGLGQQADDLLGGSVDRLQRSEEHTSELQSLRHLVCRL